MRHSPPSAGSGFPDWEAVDAAISDGAEASFDFLERLVASPAGNVPPSGSWPPNWTAWASR
jgi:hypothetical protein